MSPPTKASSWRYGVALSLLFCVPGIIALAFELYSGADRSPATGDTALLELGVRAAMDFEQWVGPYSRHLFHHPGPFYFYSLLPAYVLGGQTASALHVGAVVFNLAALLLILRLAAPLFDTGASRVGAVIALALWSSHFSGLLSPTGWAAIWTPVLTLMPYGLLLICSVRLADGKLAFLIPSLLLHAFLSQTHVAFVPVASVALLTGVVGYLVARRRTPSADGRRLRWELTAAAVLLLLWLPVAVDQLSMSHNLSELFEFFVTNPRKRLSFGVAVGTMARAMAAPFFGALRLPYPDAGLLPLVLLAAQGLLLGSLTIAAYRGADRSGRTLLTTLVGQWVVAAIAVRAVDAPNLHYLTHWLGVLSCWTWAVILRSASGWLDAFDWAARPPGRGVHAACALVAILAAAIQVLALPTGRAWVEHGKPAEQAIVRELAAVLDAEREAGRGAPLRIAENEAWGVAAGLMLMADRSGAEQPIEPRWAFMYGDRFALEEAGEGAFVLSLTTQLGMELLAFWPPFHLYRDAEPATEEAEEELVELELWDARGVGRGAPDDWRQVIEGPARLLVDGQAPEPGAPWDHPTAAAFRGPDAWVVLHLPTVPVERLRVMADNNDEYSLEASVDGMHFEEIAHIAGVPEPGLRWRQVPMPRDRALTWLRISPTAGDGLYSLAEVQAVRGEGFVADVLDVTDTSFGAGWAPPEAMGARRGRWASEEQAFLTVPAPPAAGSTLVFSAAPAPAAAGSQTLSIHLGQRLLSSVTMQPELRSYAAALPPMECGETCELRLSFTHADPAAWFEAIMLIPAAP